MEEREEGSMDEKEGRRERSEGFLTRQLGGGGCESGLHVLEEVDSTHLPLLQ